MGDAGGARGRMDGAAARGAWGWTPRGPGSIPIPSPALRASPAGALGRPGTRHKARARGGVVFISEFKSLAGEGPFNCSDGNYENGQKQPWRS
jgi:hypothetical protein